jgi:hypothetical protein
MLSMNKRFFPALLLGTLLLGRATAQTPAPMAFEKLPAGQIRANGWLETQLRNQTTGLTGTLDQMWDDVGPNSGWLGGTGESWERGPYYLRGLVSLAYVTQDERMLAKIKPWIESILASQTPDGYFGPKKDEDWWPRWLVAQLLITHHESTADARVIPFLQRYYAFERAHLEAKPLKSWAKARGGEDLTSLLWLYRRTSDPALLELARLVDGQTNRWVEILEKEGPIHRRAELDTTRWLDDSPLHGVNLAHGPKYPALRYQLSGGQGRYRAAFERGFANVNRYHGQVWGVPVGDEKVRRAGSSSGSETCQTVELLHSLEYNLRTFGDAAIGDALEKAAFNALPAFFDPAFTVHPYYILPNSVAATVQPRPFPNPHHGDVLTYGVISGYPCCTVNMHLGFPMLAEHLWLKTGDGRGLVAAVYAPSTVRTELADGTAVTIQEETGYPFGDEITFVMQPGRAAAFPLHLRIPGWCTGAEVRVNGRAAGKPGAGTFFALTRTWKPGDRVTLRLPMQPVVTRGEANAATVQRGPLVYALSVRENWREFLSRHTPKPVPFGWKSFEISTESPWNYGLVLGPDAARSFTVRTTPLAEGQSPWDPAHCPIQLVAKARRLPQWQANGLGLTDPLPLSPAPSTEPIEDVRLLPIGATRLRIALLPVAGN